MVNDAAQLRARLTEGAARLRREVAEPVWQPLLSQDGITVTYRTATPERYMASVELSARAADVLKAVYDFSERLKWDKALSSASKVLEPLEADLDVVYQFVEGRLSVAARDFVNGRLKIEAADMTVVVHNAVENVLPVRSPAVRGKHFDVGYVIVPLGEAKCKLFWFVQTEFGGWIIVNVRSIVGQNIFEIINNLRAYLARGA